METRKEMVANNLVCPLNNKKSCRLGLADEPAPSFAHGVLFSAMFPSDSAAVDNGFHFYPDPRYLSDRPQEDDRPSLSPAVARTCHLHCRPIETESLDPSELWQQLPDGWTHFIIGDLAPAKSCLAAACFLRHLINITNGTNLRWAPVSRPNSLF